MIAIAKEQYQRWLYTVGSTVLWTMAPSGICSYWYHVAENRQLTVLWAFVTVALAFIGLVLVGLWKHLTSNYDPNEPSWRRKRQIAASKLARLEAQFLKSKDDSAVDGPNSGGVDKYEPYLGDEKVVSWVVPDGEPRRMRWTGLSPLSTVLSLALGWLVCVPMSYVFSSDVLNDKSKFTWVCCLDSILCWNDVPDLSSIL